MKKKLSRTISLFYCLHLSDWPHCVCVSVCVCVCGWGWGGVCYMCALHTRPVKPHPLRLFHLGVTFSPSSTNRLSGLISAGWLEPIRKKGEFPDKSVICQFLC